MSGQLTNRSTGAISRWRKNNGLRIVSIAREQQLQQYEETPMRNALRWAWDSEWSSIPKGEDMQHWVKHPICISVSSLRFYYRNHEQNKKRSADRAREKYQLTKHEPLTKLKLAIRNSISRICRKSGYRKNARTLEYIGCTMQEAREQIESKFKSGMTWENHGIMWEIDHIIPLASFDLSDERQRMNANHISNLQPLWKWENRAKAARLDWAA